MKLDEQYVKLLMVVLPRQSPWCSVVGHTSIAALPKEVLVEITMTKLWQPDF